MPLQITSGDEYTGETYIYCDSHPGKTNQLGREIRSNSGGSGMLFIVDIVNYGHEKSALLSFLADHYECK